MSKPNRILVIDVPILHLDWIESDMPRLHALSKDWHRAFIDPTFPAVTCPSQATLTTGASPGAHGIVANGLFDPEARFPEMWVFPDERVEATRIWETYKAAGRKTGAFFIRNIRHATAECVLLERPRHREDGSVEFWCWHRPEGLYPRLVEKRGHFNLLKFWGPMAGVESSRWIAEATRDAVLEQDLDLALVYLSHTDYAPQKFGPRSDACRAAHRELDGVIADLIEPLADSGRELEVVIVSEYAITSVDRVVFPNRVLRELSLFKVKEEDERENQDLASPAFALVDHQIAHVYCEASDAPRIAERFRAEPGVAAVFTDPAECGLGHPRSGRVILMADRDAWFAYPWWEDPDRSPAFATTIDIHAKPGYDPLEMFWDASINGISQDVRLIRGSHGALARDPDQKAALLASLPGADSILSTAGVHAALKAALEASGAGA